MNLPKEMCSSIIPFRAAIMKTPYKNTIQLAAEKKDSKNGAARKFFGPSYFEPTLCFFLPLDFEHRWLRIEKVRKNLPIDSQ